MLACLREPPRKGSLQESVLFLLIMKQESLQYQRDLAFAQILLGSDENKKAGVDMFHAYHDDLFPWHKKHAAEEKNTRIQQMLGEISRGVLSVHPVSDPNKAIKSRLKKKIERPASEKEKDALYKKIGMVVPK